MFIIYEISLNILLKSTLHKQNIKKALSRKTQEHRHEKVPDSLLLIQFSFFISFFFLLCFLPLGTVYGARLEWKNSKKNSKVWIIILV